MQKVESSFYSIGERSHLTIAAVNDEAGSVFDRLPLFQPWVWKFFAAVGIVSFIVGLALAAWAKYSLYHLITK